MAKRRRVYGITTPFEDVFPIPISSTTSPTSADKGYEVGQVWIDTSADTAYFLTSVVAGSATWALASPGASDVDTLTGDSGGAISPAGGNITLAGGTNITSAGAGSTVTFNLDAAITLATSVTSALYTTGAGTDLLITAVTGQDVVMKLSDAGGVQKFSITDSADAEVASIDSDGAFTTTGLTFTGLLTANASATILTAGTALNLGSDNNSAAVNLAVGTTARAVGIANSAAAHTVTIGSVTGAASLDLLVGTGNFSLDGAATSDLIVGASLTSGIITIGGTAQTGTMTLGDSSGTNIVQIGAGEGATTVAIAGGATAAKVVDIATGAIDNLVTIGTVTGAAQLDLLCGTGNFSLNGATTSTYTVAASTTSGTITIGGTAQTGTFSIGDTSGTMILELGAGEGATTVAIAGGATNAKAVDIAIGAVANVVRMGTVTGAASMALKVGTGNFTLEGNVASTYDISSTGANTGTAKFASGTGARTVEIAGGGTGIKTVNIAAAATADVVTIGTTTGAGSTTIAAGTGDIILSGTVKEVNSEFAYSTGTDLTISQSPILTTAATTAGAATGATGDVNLMYMQDGCLMEQFILGAGQTIIGPRMNGTNGLLISLDLVDDEGAEYNFGARDNAKHAFTIGTSAAFFIEAQIYAADLSGLEPLWLGFRKVEANNAAFASYTDFYGIGMNNVTSATNISLTGRLNSGGVTLQDGGTAWTGGDGGTVTLKVLVSAAGVITATLDGGAPSSPLAQTFDNTDIVMPFIHFLHDTTTPGAIGLKSLKIGFQA